MPEIIISTENSIAIYDPSYTKHVNVFRLCLPNGSEYLFQYHSNEVMADWMNKINVAATYSSVGLRMPGTLGEEIVGRTEAELRASIIEVNTLHVVLVVFFSFIF